MREQLATWELIAMFVDDSIYSNMYFVEEVLEKGIGKMYISRLRVNEQIVRDIHNADIVVDPERFEWMLLEVNNLITETISKLADTNRYVEDFYKRHEGTTDTDEMFYLEYLMDNEAEMLLAGYMRLYGLYKLVYGIDVSLSEMKSMVRTARD